MTPRAGVKTILALRRAFRDSRSQAGAPLNLPTISDLQVGFSPVFPQSAEAVADFALFSARRGGSLCPDLCPPSREIASEMLSSEG
jgi:hypothetical protein